MDLGCIDMGCVEKPRKETSVEKEHSPKESVMSASKHGKSSKGKDAVRSSLSALNKLTSQISKPPRRKTSPLNWFPRKKVEPYLKRKIKMLQEVDGMSSTLDETLGDSNPHYSRVLREKIAIREAADKAMEARKAAMVEASWCRILQAARIESKEAEAQLLKAEASAAEALEAASAAGVIMNDIPDSSSAQSHYKIELGSTTHTVSATFETAFEVDKQVSAAVKAAFIKLASCPSINKDEFRELLRKISENPDCCTDENCNDLSSDLASSECESESGSELESTSFSNEEFSDARMMMKQKKRQVSNKFNMANVVDMMLDRLRCLKEDELASLATIVATSGLNAALAETENTKLQSSSSAIDNTDNRSVKVVQSRMSLGGRNTRKPSIDTELPSLDKFLVKRLTRLEREVLEARNARKSEADEKLLSVDNTSSRIGLKTEECTAVSDLGSVLVKRSSKLEKEVEEARMNGSRLSEVDNKTSQRAAENDIPSLDKFLVKRLTRLEREVQEAKNRTKLDSIQADMTRSEGKENMDQNRDTGKKSCHADALSSNYESLDKVLVKRVSRLEKEKLEFRTDEQMAIKSKRKESYKELESHGGSLDQVLVKHKSRLEREKMGGTEQQEEDMTRHSVCRRQARERELQQAWGGLSLGNSIRPHVSRLQRDKAAWIEAEEEERKRVVEEEEVL